MTDAAKIARGLTKAQREALHRARQNSLGHWLIPAYRDMGKMRQSLQLLGLCNDVGRINKAGLAVRAELERIADE